MGHGQGIHYKLRVHGIGHGPTHDHPGAQIHDYGQVHPAFTGAQVGNISAQHRGGYWGIKHPPQVVFAQFSVRIRNGGAYLLASVLRDQIVLRHDGAHRVQRGFNTFSDQVSKNGASTGKPFVLGREKLCDAGTDGKPAPTGRRCRHRGVVALLPDVIASAANAQDACHHGHRVSGLGRAFFVEVVDNAEEVVFYCSLAKKALTFFKNSFSSSSSRIRLAISAGSWELGSALRR